MRFLKCWWDGIVFYSRKTMFFVFIYHATKYPHLNCSILRNCHKLRENERWEWKEWFTQRLEKGRSKNENLKHASPYKRSLTIFFIKFSIEFSLVHFYIYFLKKHFNSLLVLMLMLPLLFWLSISIIQSKESIGCSINSLVEANQSKKYFFFLYFLHIAKILPFFNIQLWDHNLNLLSPFKAFIFWSLFSHNQKIPLKIMNF